MKKGKSFLISVFLISLGMIMFFTGCTSSPSVTEGSGEGIAITVSPGPNQSVVVIQRKRSSVAAAMSMKVWLNNEEVASGIRNGNEIQLIVPNGEHRLQAGSTTVDRGNEVTFTVNGEAIFFLAEPRMGALSARFSLAQIGKRRL